MGLMKRLDERAGLMGRMMRTVGADDTLPSGMILESTMRTAAARCMGCERPQDCANWLEEHADGAAHAPGFCPNGELFAAWTGRSGN
ncbi:MULTISPECIES: DUF6455 family protein [unclassified Stappia]|uniref:DUF6455 family protein n=1 Tax=unclassified Stappia TaxID=2629676 RepID=UPI0016436DE8|nr:MULTISPECIES: DUF6455 family protein [unclassified Stappia]